MTIPGGRPTGWGDPPADRPSLAALRAAAVRLRGRVARTGLSEFAPGLLLKDETAQPTGSFKIRGVLNWALVLSDEERGRGLLTFSAGNTALALGHAARLLGVPCRSFLPDYASAVKVRALRAAGVQTRLVPFDELARWLFAASWRAEPEAFLNPWTEPAMLAGHGTIGLELVEDRPDLAAVYVPVGGGALVAGVAAAVKALAPAARIIGVQTESYPALAASRALGHPAWVEPRPTICDGVAVPFVTDQIFPLLQSLVDRVVTVPEDEVRRAIRRLHRAGIRAEGAGALATAAALLEAAPGPAACLVTGRNIEPELLAGITGS